MELLGLIWAASLPHQTAVFPMSRAFLSAETTNEGGPVRGQAQPVNLDPSPSERQGLHLPLLTPQGFQPQLDWQVSPKVDWEQWAVTAKVTVVREVATIKNLTQKNQDSAAQLPVGIYQSTCPAAADLAQQLALQQLDAAQSRYSIQVNDVTIGALPDRQAADEIAAQIRQAMSTVEAHPFELEPQIEGDMANALVKGQTVFELTQESLPDGSPSAAKVVTAWVNNLRHMFGASTLDLGTTQMVAQGLGETDQVIGGTASWYGPYFHGRLTATGEVFDQHELTAAHKTLPFGTMLKVRNLLNDRTVVVRINDRGPYIGDRSLDLSYAAAQCLDSEIVGVIPYEATILEPGMPIAWRTEATMAQR